MKKTRKGQMHLAHENGTMEKLKAYMEQDAELKAFLTKPLEEMSGGYRSVVASVLSVKVDTYRRYCRCRDKVTPVYFDPANAKTIFDILEELFGPHNEWGEIPVEFLVSEGGKLIGCIDYTLYPYPPYLVEWYPMVKVWPWLNFVNDMMLISFSEDTNWNALEDDMKCFVQKLRRKYCFVYVVPVDGCGAKGMLASVFKQHNKTRNVPIDIKCSNYDGHTITLDRYVVTGEFIPYTVMPLLQGIYSMAFGTCGIFTRLWRCPVFRPLSFVLEHLYFGIAYLVCLIKHRKNKPNDV